MIGKGSILYDVTAGVTIAPVSAIGRLDLERSEIETTTHGRGTPDAPGRPETGRPGHRPPELPGERRTGGPAPRPLRIGRVRGICSDLPDHSAYAFEAFVSALGQETPGRTDPSVVPVLTDRSD